MRKPYLTLILLLIFSFTLTINSFGQWSKGKKNRAPADADIPTVKIIDNNPKNAENLHISLLPFYWNAHNVSNIGARIESFYRKDNQWSIGGYLFKSYSLLHTEYFDGGSEDINKPFEFGVEGDYYFANKKKKREYKIIINSDLNYDAFGTRTITNYYVPAKGKEFHYYGARGGYNLFIGSAITSYQPDGVDSYFVTVPQKITNGVFHIGLSRLKIYRMKAKVEGHGEHIQKAFKYIYADLLLSTNTSYAQDSRRDPLNIDKWAKLPIGFRIGYRTLPAKLGRYQLSAETGFKPGPSQLELGDSRFGNAFYLNFGFGIGLGLKK